jgi:hypothetical protein
MTGKFNTVRLLLINSFLDIWRFNTVSLLHVNLFYVFGVSVTVGTAYERVFHAAVLHIIIVIPMIVNDVNLSIAFRGVTVA